MAQDPDHNRQRADEALIAATIAVAEAGRPLMLRVVPEGQDVLAWSHYPADDAVDARTGARWFYHAHGPGERDAGEHGHFHLFLDRACFADDHAQPLAGPPGGTSSGADVVHIAAVAIAYDGLPTRLFTVNRWVTDEWLYPAAVIEAKLDRFDLTDATGDPLVNAWLSAAAAFFRREIVAVLRMRDAEIARWPDHEKPFEDRGLEILSSVAIDINAAVDAAG